MAPRRRGRALIALGAILIVASLFAVFTGLSPSGVQEATALRANDPTAEYFAEVSWSVLSGGTIHGTFSVANGTPVTVFVFNDADYKAYVSGQNVTGLYSVTAPNGTIDLQVSGWDTYHVVLAHAPGYGSQEQDVSVDLTGTGIDPGYFLGGMAVLLIGVVLLIVGIRRTRRLAGPSSSGVLQSRATYLPAPVPPSGPSTTPSGDGVIRIPPPLPGTADAPTQPSTAASAPLGNVVITLENRSTGAETARLIVNGVAVTEVTVPAGTTQMTTVTARLSSPFGSMVSVQAVTSSGRQSEQSVFVGTGGTGQVLLRIA